MGCAGGTRVAGFAPPLQGEVARSAGGVSPHRWRPVPATGAPLRQAFGLPPPLAGEDSRSILLALPRPDLAGILRIHARIVPAEHWLALAATVDEVADRGAGR